MSGDSRFSATMRTKCCPLVSTYMVSFRCENGEVIEEEQVMMKKDLTRGSPLTFASDVAVGIYAPTTAFPDTALLLKTDQLKRTYLRLLLTFSGRAYCVGSWSMIFPGVGRQ